MKSKKLYYITGNQSKFKEAEEIINRSKDSLVYRCSAPTFEIIKGVSLGKLLGEIEVTNKENVAMHWPNHYTLDRFLFDKAVEKYGKEIIIIDYTNVTNGKIDETSKVRATVYPNSTGHLEESGQQHVISLEELMVPKFGIPVFYEDLAKLQGMTGRKFVSPIGKQIIYLESEDHPENEVYGAKYSSTPDGAAKLLYERLLQNFGEEFLICDFRTNSVNMSEFGPLEYKGMGIVIKPEGEKK
jgi:hypothetical protein